MSYINSTTKISELLELYDDCLDEGGEVTVCGCTFRPSEILKGLDPTAYHCGFLDYVDSIGLDIDELEDDVN